jgi:hypothetical protein
MTDKKKPKPIGSGNYSVCKRCLGTGWSYSMKAAKISTDPKHGQVISGHRCKACKGLGWVDAER